jgi:EAL domain-containing protein (putative c-di-GMP-specific phosphodiesterase class I)/GGDEF domain-containing protein
MIRRIASWLSRVRKPLGASRDKPPRCEGRQTPFVETVERALRRARENGGPEFAALILGLDRFRQIDAGLCEAAGRQLLQDLTHRLEEALARPGALSAVGEDALGFLVHEDGGTNDAIRAAERALDALERPLWIDGHEVAVGGRIGLVIRAGGYGHAEDVVRDAGTALEKARTRDHPDYQVFDRGMREAAVQRLRLETDLRRALRRGELSLRYQPIVGLETRRVCGFEALVRWTHPTRGVVAPDEFIPVAEDCGLITPIGYWVLREACAQGREWLDWFGAAAVPIGVNVSARQLASPDFAECVAAILAETRLPGRLLTLDITESAVAAGPAAVAPRLEQLRELGVRVAMDDFGTGRSGLGLLHSLPIDTLKIDRSFVARIGSDPNGSAMVRTLVSLAQTLGVDAVAEGVEARQQLETLRGLSCDFAQGNLFSQPVPALQATEALKGARRF